MESVIKKIIDKLREQGYNIYMPTQHKGECIEPYIVVKLDGVSPLLNVSSERPIYTFLCYVPENRYSMLEQYCFDVKKALKQLYPMIDYAGNETPSIYEEAKKAHMISFQFVGIRKIYKRR